MNLTTLGPGLLATTGGSFDARSVIMLLHPDLRVHAGDRHRQQRKMLNPAFNINHMREMIPIFFDVTHKVSRYRRWPVTLVSLTLAPVKTGN